MPCKHNHKLRPCGCGVCPKCFLSDDGRTETCSHGREHNGKFNTDKERKNGNAKKRKRNEATTTTSFTSAPAAASMAVSCGHKISLCGCGVCLKCFLSSDGSPRHVPMGVYTMEIIPRAKQQQHEKRLNDHRSKLTRPVHTLMHKTTRRIGTKPPNRLSAKRSLTR
jgi:hypothetical protein